MLLVYNVTLAASGAALHAVQTGKPLTDSTGWGWGLGIAGLLKALRRCFYMQTHPSPVTVKSCPGSTA